MPVVPGIEIISIIGSVFFIVAFGALNLGLVKSDTYKYQLANIFGALCFTYTAFDKVFNPGLFITQSIWALIGVYGAYKIYKISQTRRAEKETGK